MLEIEDKGDNWRACQTPQFSKVLIHSEALWNLSHKFEDPRDHYFASFQTLLLSILVTQNATGLYLLLFYSYIISLHAVNKKIFMYS